jgi:hypothetical protein
VATQEHRRKAAAQTGLYLAVITAIVVVVNVLSAGAYARIDVTKNERYTLSKGSGNLVQSLNGPPLGKRQRLIELLLPLLLGHGVRLHVDLPARAIEDGDLVTSLGHGGENHCKCCQPYGLSHVRTPFV